MSLRDRMTFRGSRRGAPPAAPGSNGHAPVAPPAAPGPGSPPATPGAPAAAAPPAQKPASGGEEFSVDLKQRRDQLMARVAELQWDLGGLAYEMAIRDRMQIELLVRRAVALQDADAELSEVERIVRMEETGTAGSCGNCGAPHSSGATFCWQCGKPLLRQISGESILRS